MLNDERIIERVEYLKSHKTDLQEMLDIVNNELEFLLVLIEKRDEKKNEKD